MYGLDGFRYVKENNIDYTDLATINKVQNKHLMVSRDMAVTVSTIGDWQTQVLVRVIVNRESNAAGSVVKRVKQLVGHSNYFDLAVQNLEQDTVEQPSNDVQEDQIISHLRYSRVIMMSNLN